MGKKCGKKFSRVENWSLVGRQAGRQAGKKEGRSDSKDTKKAHRSLHLPKEERGKERERKERERVCRHVSETSPSNAVHKKEIKFPFSQGCQVAGIDRPTADFAQYFDDFLKP